MPALPDHAATEAAFHAALWAPQTPPGLAGDDVSLRFSVYRNNVQHGLTRAIAARFPVVERLVGAEFLAAMARVFAARHPPRTPVIQEWGEGFSAFLATFPPVAGLPYLPDVARLEWLRGQAVHAADAPTIDPEALTRFQPDTLRLVLAPSVSAFASRWPALTIWAANQPGAAPVSVLPDGPQYALVARTPGFAVLTEPIDADSHALLSGLQAGRSLAEAATSDPTPLLALLIRNRLIAALDGDPA